MWTNGKINALQIAKSNCVNIFDENSNKINNDSEVFLGNLKNYTFYFDRTKEETTVYSNSRISKQQIISNCR